MVWQNYAEHPQNVSLNVSVRMPNVCLILFYLDKRLSDEELMLNSYIEDIDKRVDKYMAPESLDREMIW